MVAEQTKGIDARFFCGIPDVSELPGAYKNAARRAPADRRVRPGRGGRHHRAGRLHHGRRLAARRAVAEEEGRSGKAALAGCRWRSLRQRRGPSRLPPRRCAGGELVAFPTETVYGLGADATNGRAVAAIFTAKGRPRFNPLIVHVPDVAAAERLGRLGELGRKLAAAFWPGPLSLVMAKREGCPVVGSRDRWPRHHRAARAGSSGRASSAAGGRPSGGRAQRQPVGPCQPHDRRACRGRSRRPRRHDPRRRADVGGVGIDRRRRHGRRRR